MCYIFVGYSKMCYKKLVTHVESHASAVSLLKSREERYTKWSTYICKTYFVQTGKQQCGTCFGTELSFKGELNWSSITGPMNRNRKKIVMSQQFFTLFLVLLVKNQHTKELISTRKTSHKHSNKDLSHLQQPSPGMQAHTRYMNSTRGTSN